MTCKCRTLKGGYKRSFSFLLASRKQTTLPSPATYSSHGPSKFSVSSDRIFRKKSGRIILFRDVSNVPAKHQKCCATFSSTFTVNKHPAPWLDIQLLQCFEGAKGRWGRYLSCTFSKTTWPLLGQAVIFA